MSKQSDLAKIHIAKKQLGLDDDAYRTILLTQAGQSSAADLDYAGRFKVLEYFKNTCNVKFTKKKNSANLNQCVESLKQWCNRAGVKHD